MSWTLLFLAGLSLGGFHLNGSMDEYVEAKPYFIAVNDFSTIELPQIVNWDRKSEIVSEEEIMVTVGGADFGFFVSVEKLEKKFVEFKMDESSRNYTSLARAECEIIEDLFFNQSGEVALFFTQVNIPGKIIFQPQRVSDTINPGSLALVFGKIEHGFLFVPNEWIFSVENNGGKFDLVNKSFDSNTLIQYVERKKTDRDFSTAKLLAQIVVLAEFVGDQPYSTSYSDENAEFRVLKPIAGDAPDIFRLSIKINEWDMVNCASFYPGEKYVLFLEPGEHGDFFLIRGKASVFHFENEEVRTHSGALVGSIEEFTIEFQR